MRVDRLVYLRTDRLGETILNLPTLAALAGRHPEMRITLLVRPQLAELMRAIPGIAGVLPHAPGDRRLWWWRALRLGWQLRAHHFDAAIVSNASKELHLAVWLAGIPLRVGYRRKWGGLLNRTLEDTRQAGWRHEVESNLALLQVFDPLLRLLPEWRLRPTEDAMKQSQRILEVQGWRGVGHLAVIHPWASTAKKEWALARYAELIRRLTETWHLPVAIVGERAMQARVPTLVPSHSLVYDLVGRLDLQELAAVLQQARLLISNDSGPVHLAAAVGTAVVALFGTSAAAEGPGRWGPWGQRHTVIAKPSMEDISVEEVLEAVKGYVG
jgi:ADP-heptose:LPS heptosyltransferase